jgi:hypothetical protein
LPGEVVGVEVVAGFAKAGQAGDSTLFETALGSPWEEAGVTQRFVGVDAGAQGEDAQAPRSLSLSICAVTRGCSNRLTALLAQLHPLAEEIVVALDERAELEAAALTAVADRVVLFSHRDPGDSVIPWLHAQCDSDWILNVDDDEVPSEALLRELPMLLGAEVTHWWLPRRWLVGSVEIYLDEPPWIPDYQLRLYRNDPATLRFSDEFHRPVIVSGPAGFARSPIWHLDCLLNSFEHRRDKAIAYERARRGMRVAGLAHNGGFYLPELMAHSRRGCVPVDDVAFIRHVLDAAPPTHRLRRGAVRRAERTEIDAYWPGAPYDSWLYPATLTRVDRLDSLAAEAQHVVTISVANLGHATWHYGPEASPLIMIGTRWLNESGELVEEGIHTPLPADLRPSSSLDIPVHVVAPSRPGTHRLSVSLVHEHVRWFGRALEWEVEVTPAHRVAVIGTGQPLEEALDRIQLEPELEPVLLPSLNDYLLAGMVGGIGPVELTRLAIRSARLRRRARRLHDGKPSAPLSGGAEACVRALAGCEELLVAGPDWGQDAAVTRQLLRLVATIRTARTLGVAVGVRLPGFTPSGHVDRFLTRLVSRRLDAAPMSHLPPASRP